MSDYYNSLAKKRKKAKRTSMPEAWRDVDFAVELFGPERAFNYMCREYLDAGTHRFDVLLKDAAC